MTISKAPEYRARDVSVHGDRAIVIGGGIAGLLAARVLSDAFTDVVVFERDPRPQAPAARRGVPQAHHVHVLLEAGRAGLEALFPGFEDDIRRAGGLTIDAGSDLKYFHHGAYLAEAAEMLPMVCASRPLFEHTIRERVAERPDVHFEYGRQITDLTVTDGQVRGVDGRAEHGHVEGELVIDAMGRTSPSPGWLAAAGYRRPTVQEVEIDLAYSSVFVDRPSNVDEAYLIAPTEANPRGGTVIPVEGDRWMVTLFGVHGHHPPRTREGLQRFAAELPTDDPHRILREFPVVSEDVHHYPFTSNRWRRYDRLDRVPDGFIPIGDAVASFNPIYGQGMSVAALEALHLHGILRDNAVGSLGDAYLDRLEETIRIIWRMTVSADFEFSETDGQAPTGTRLFNWYLNRLVKRAHRDGTLTTAFARVLRLERPPRSLVAPPVLRRVLLK